MKFEVQNNTLRVIVRYDNNTFKANKSILVNEFRLNLQTKKIRL